jgi:hypothetical protein
MIYTEFEYALLMLEQIGASLLPKDPMPYETLQFFVYVFPSKTSISDAVTQYTNTL